MFKRWWSRIISRAVPSERTSACPDLDSTPFGSTTREGRGEDLSLPAPRHELPEWWTDDLPRVLSFEEIGLLEQNWRDRVRHQTMQSGSPQSIPQDRSLPMEHLVGMKS
jgi:hypothetical protein